MSTTTTNYGLIKPDTTDPILVGQLNDNADVIDATLKSLSDALDVAKLGIKYKGEVNYYSNLPSSGNQIGDAYTVKYAGSSGTTPDGTEYVWGTVSGTNQWINFSKDSYTKAEVDALLALKQNALTTAQLAAVNSGIDSTKVAQIETNKNNISSLTPALVECVDNEKKNYLYYTLDILKVINTNGTWSGNAFTHTSGVTFTLNSDMSISVSGTNNSGSDCAFLLMNTGYTDDVRTIPTGTYIASGCPTGGSNSTYLLYFWKGKTTSPLASYGEYGDSATIYLNYTNADTQGSNIAFIVKTNNTVDFTVYPMICKPDVWAVSHKYVPHAMSNAELTAAIQAIQAQLSNQ